MLSIGWKNVVAISFLLLFFSSSFVQASWENKMRGYVIFPTSPDSYCGDDFYQTVDNLKSMGVNTVSLIIPWYQDRLASSTQHRGWNTASDSSLHCGMNYITSKNLKVALLVHAEVDDGTWRAKIDPTDRDIWFKSMGGIIKKYAREFATPHHAEVFSVGTEMHSTVSNKYNADNASRPGKYRWADIVEDVREEYDGQVTYSAQHRGPRSSVFEDNDLIKNLDTVGFSAYWPMHNPRNDTERVNSWKYIEEKYLLPAYKKYNKPVVFMEGGYRPCSWALNRPWDSWSECSYDAKAQADAYEGMLSFMADKFYFDGAPSLWAFEDDPEIGGEGNTQYTPWGKLAEEVVRSYWQFESDNQDDDGDSDDDTDDGDDDSDSDDGAKNECLATMHTATNGGWGYNSLTNKGCLVDGASNNDSDDDSDDDGDSDDDTDDGDDDSNSDDGAKDECLATIHTATNGGWGYNSLTGEGCQVDSESYVDEVEDKCVATEDTATNGGWGYNQKTKGGCKMDSDKIASLMVPANKSIIDDVKSEKSKKQKTSIKIQKEKTVEEVPKVKKVIEEMDKKEVIEKKNEDNVEKMQEDEKKDEKEKTAEKVEKKDKTEGEDKCVATEDTATNGGWGYNELTEEGCQI